MTFEGRRVAIDTLDIEVGSSDEVVRFYVGDPAPLGGAVEPADPSSETVMAAEVAGELAPERGSPGRARRLVVAALRERGCDEAFVDDVALVVTELASNAVLHAGTPFSISVRARDSMLRVAVSDGVPPDATERDGGLTQRPLHGLDLIDALSIRWGVEGVSGGKVVWAELLELPPEAPKDPVPDGPQGVFR
jgi:hypothetical protein